MKTKDFERILKSLGFEIVRVTGHTIWGKGGQRIPVPMGKEINRMMARRILKGLNYPCAI